MENKYVEELELKIKNGKLKEEDLVLCDRVALKEKLIKDINNIRDKISINKKKIRENLNELNSNN